MLLPSSLDFFLSQHTRRSPNMNKDQSLLGGGSPFFTEDVLKKIIWNHKSLDPKDMDIISWDFEETSAKGDSNLSILNRILISGKYKAISVSSYNLYSKICPRGKRLDR